MLQKISNVPIFFQAPFQLPNISYLPNCSIQVCNKAGIETVWQVNNPSTHKQGKSTGSLVHSPE